MKFNTIVGNPPYQIMDGGAGASAKPVYNLFVNTAKQLDPQYISMIMPSRWFAGGKGLDTFRDEMLNDIHLKRLDDFLNPELIFPNTNIRGGLCYFLWDKKHDTNKFQTLVVTHDKNKPISTVKRLLKTEGINLFIRNYEAISILNKVKNKDFISFSLYISSRKPFGLSTDFIKDDNFKNN